MHTATQTAVRQTTASVADSGPHLSPTVYLPRAAAPAAAREPRGGRVGLFLAGPASLRTVTWGPTPAIYPPGASMAVLEGDPTRPELFIVRFRLPDGFEIAPHIHPTAEFLTVVSGMLMVGLGSTRRRSERRVLARGDSMTVPARQPHHAMARGTTVVQLNALGPFDLTYVYPSTAPWAARR